MGPAAQRRRIFSSIATTLMACILWCVLPVSQARANPDQHWRSAEEKHFVVHYPAGAEAFAERVLLVAERAYTRLSQEFKHEMKLRTHITVVTTTDGANGFAGPTPFPHITLYATAPDTLSVLNTHDDWIDVLVTHELVHVIQLDITHGIVSWVNFIGGFGGLGKIWTPNQFAPRWMVEGIATYEESKYTGGGRYRSAIFDMFVRMAVLEGRFPTLEQASNEARYYPHGSGAYLWGLHFVRFLAAQYGIEKLVETFHRHGRRIAPFGFNREMQHVFGMNMDQLWREFSQYAFDRFQAQAATIRVKGLMQGQRMTFSASGSTSNQSMRDPQFSPDDKWIYFYDDDGNRDPGFRRIARAGGSLREGIGLGNQAANTGIETVLAPIPSATNFGFVGDDASTLIFAQPARFDRRYDWLDLYRVRPGVDPFPEQLTFGLRAREPAVSPDGSQVAFVRNDVGQSRLGLLNLLSRKVEEFAPVDSEQSVFEPTFSPDGRHVVYSLWRPGGFRNLYLLDLASGKTQQLTFGKRNDTSPTFSPDGRYLLFSADFGGVHNVWAIDLEADASALYRVTNVLGGAFQPAISHDQKSIAYVGFTSDGFELWQMPFDPSSWREEVSFDHRGQSSAYLERYPEGNTSSPIERSKPYRGYKTVFPRTISLSALQMQNSGFLNDYSASLEGSDALDIHHWSLSLGYVPNLERWAGNASYTWSRYVAQVQAGFARSYAVGNSFYRFSTLGPAPGHGKAPEVRYLQTDYLERQTAVSAQVSLPILRNFVHGVSASTRYDFTYLENLDAKKWVADPNAPAAALPTTGRFGSLRFGSGYSNSRSTRFGLWDERGRAMSMAVSLLHPALGSDQSDLRFEANYNEYLAMPWRGHQVLALRFYGGMATRGRAFRVGGVDPIQDILNAAAYRVGEWQGGAIRGYAPRAFAGRNAAVLNAEYRVPLFDIERGASLLPIYLTRATLIGFTDWGRAFDGPILLKDLAGGAGAAMVLSFRMGYRELVSLYFQYAHGFDKKDGLDTYRVFLGRSF